MDVFPKFIIETDNQEGDCLIIGKCTYHKQLATDTSKVKGGGWWSLDTDTENFIITLFGDSSDFGRAEVNDVVNCVKNKKVFTNRTLTRNIAEKYKFKYRDVYDKIIDLN
jgi:hypothetical protein